MAEQKQPSERALIADRLAQFITGNNLANPYGGEVTVRESEKGKPRAIPFSQPGYLDGTVLVYGPKFILVKARYIGRQIDRVFTTEQNASDFLDLCFCKRDWDAAMKIPVKESKSK